jgi:hypothetical protein
MNSIGLQTAMALGRALFIALLAISVSAHLSRWLMVQQGRRRVFAWALTLAPFFTPPLLVSYAYSKFAMALLVSVWGHEALYLGVLALKLIPVAVVLRVLLPPALSAQAWHAYRMLPPAPWWKMTLFRLRAAGHGPWVVAGLVFLLAFTDFELASLWSIKTWTMAVFDAQIGGYALGATLHLAAWPFAIQLCVLTAIALSRRELPGVHEDSSAPAGAAGWIYPAVAAGFVSLVPLVIVASQAVTGIPSLVENFVLGRELGASVVFALIATTAATGIAAFTRKPSALSLLLVTPGLFGALIVSLLLLALFQMPLLRALYDTPLPLGLALTLLLVPLALLLGALWLRPSPALHIARQTRNRRLMWELSTRPRVIASGILFCWAYFDFTASSILAPTGFTPVFVRLHNLAHYGQTAVLSAMMLAAFATPILVLLLTGTTWRLYARGHGR